MPSKATKSTNKKPDKSIPSSSSTTKSSTTTKKSSHPPKKPTSIKPPSAKNPSPTPITTTTNQFALLPPLPAQQQTILDTFSAAFPIDDDDVEVEGLKKRVQAVKGFLYAREFGGAFGGGEGLREAYAVRWSPGRAVGYAGVFLGLGDVLGLKGRSNRGGILREVRTEGEGEEGNGIEDGLVRKQESHRKKIVCVGGGGGAELVALASHLAMGLESDGGKQRDEKVRQGLLGGGVDCVLVDVADWKGVTEKLMMQVDANLVGINLTKRAASDPDKGQHGDVTLEDELADMTVSSTSAAAPTPQSPPFFHAESVQADILTLPPGQLQSLLSSAHLVTIMFTLNELYTTSSTLTTTFLLSLTDIVAPGAMLLVLDSPGSYSTVGVGADGKEKKYPMAWLLDHTLLVSASGAQGTGGKGAEEGRSETMVKEGEMDEGKEGRQGNQKAPSVKRQKWEKIEECDSRWCRLSKGLRYPIDLEDMRYQLHLYRRV